MLNIYLKISDNTYGIKDSKYTVLLIITQYGVSLKWYILLIVLLMKYLVSTVFFVISHLSQQEQLNLNNVFHIKVRFKVKLFSILSSEKVDISSKNDCCKKQVRLVPLLWQQRRRLVYLCRLLPFYTLVCVFMYRNEISIFKVLVEYIF